MLKRFFTLAALGGLATAASAQTTTQLYGLLDLSVQYLQSGANAPFAGSHLTRLADGTTYGPGSRWGLRVNEDLGDGMRAGALAEFGFNADTGTLGQGGRACGRQCFIYLSSTKLGDIRLGRQYMLHDELLPLAHPVGGVTALSPGGVYTLPGGTIPIFLDAPRIDNAIQYLSPSFGGFRVQAMVALSEGTQDRYQALKASYAQGPVNVALVHEWSKARGPVAPGAPSTVNKISEIAGSYDFGVAKVYAGLQKGSDLTTGVGTQIGTLTLPGLTGGAATKTSAYSVGVDKTIDVFNVHAGYANVKFSNASGAERTIGRYGVGGVYYLSKQTSIYGSIAFASGDLKDFVNEKRIYQLGLRKAF